MDIKDQIRDMKKRLNKLEEKLDKKLDNMTKIRNFILDYEFEYISHNDIIVTNEYIKIPLPSSNTEWTFEVWDFVKAFVDRFPDAYPSFYEDDAAEMQYIDLESYS